MIFTTPPHISPRSRAAAYPSRGLFGGILQARMRTYSGYALYVLEVALFAGVYYLAARVGLSVDPVNSFASLVWPPTGIAIATLFLLGNRLWPGIAIAAFLANYFTGAPLVTALVIALGNSLEALFAVYMLRASGFSPLFSRLRDSISYISSVAPATLVSATVGVAALAASGMVPPGDIMLTWVSWWVGDFLSAIIVGALLLRWFCRPIFTSWRTPAQLAEGLAFMLFLIVLSLIIFWEALPVLPLNQVPYLVFAPLAWGALRVGPRLMTLAVITMAVIAVMGTVGETGPFAGQNGLIFLQMFIGVKALVALLLVSAVEERKDTVKHLSLNVEELKEDVSEISAADSAKNDFMAILSHELRNPLAPVMSSLELMRLQKGNEKEFATTIDTAYENLQHMTRILDDLLDVSRISRQKFTLHREHVELQSMVRRSIDMAASFVRSRRHELALGMAEEPIMLYADPVRIEQIIVNLINNAAKYTEPGGRITIIVKSEKDTASICVSDTGIGIPREMLAAIFEPFKQLNRGKTATGLGLGLSLTKQLTEMHGGSISVKSEGPGRGSEFVVTLPLATTPAVNAAPTSHDSPTRIGQRVLIVDDNSDAGRALEQLLEHRGHTTELATDGASALKSINSFKPQIALIDIGLPDIDGYSLAEQIHAMNDAPVLIALSGYGQEEDRERSRLAGFKHHLTKPVRIADLEGALRSSLNSYKEA